VQEDGFGLSIFDTILQYVMPLVGLQDTPIIMFRQSPSLTGRILGSVRKEPASVITEAGSK
jgi:hypothetical protein